MITPIGISAQSTGKITTEANGRMGKYDFLKLMISQMRHQDPLNPMDNSEMAAQLAQFSQLEQLLDMSQAFTSLQTVAMLGKIVKADGIDGSVIAGRVASVNMNDDTPIMTLDTGAIIALADVREVTY